MSGAPRILKPLELGIVVSDLDASKAFYGDQLGLEPQREISIGADVGKRTGVANEGFTISRFTAPCGTVVKLLKRSGRASDQAASRSEQCSRLADTFLTLVVDDLEALTERLTQAGVVGPEGEAQITIVRAGMRLAFVHDPDGYPIELVEYGNG
ncbi:MAG: VOC family protein [Pseudomonadota bacterium]